MAVLLFLIALIAPARPAVCASPDADLPGKWHGHTQDAMAEPVPVTLEVTATAAELDFGPDRNCSAKALWAGSQDKTETYRFSEADGGWCRNLTNGVLEIRRGPAGLLHAEARHTARKIKESLTLEKADPAATASSKLIGQWAGQTRDAHGDPVAVKLVIQAEQDQLKAVLDYGPDRNCASEAVWAVSEGKVNTFRFSQADGGWCRNLTNGVMEVTEIQADTLSLRVRHSKSGIDETISLEKQ